MRGEFEKAAPFIGIAIVLDMLDGRIARMTGTTSEFGLQFDSLADVISFGMAPAILSFQWGLASLGRLGWAAAFLFVTAAALRLARFNIQSPPATSATSSACRARRRPAIPAATVFLLSRRAPRPRSEALPALAMVIVPALLMVSTIRFRSFKSIGSQTRRPYRVLILFAVFIALLVTHPQWMLVTLAYGYLLSAFVGLAWSRLRRRPN